MIKIFEHACKKIKYYILKRQIIILSTRRFNNQGNITYELRILNPISLLFIHVVPKQRIYYLLS